LLFVLIVVEVDGITGRLGHTIDGQAQALEVAFSCFFFKLHFQGSFSNGIFDNRFKGERELSIFRFPQFQILGQKWNRKL